MKKAAKMSGSREEEEDKVKSLPNSTSFHHNHNSNLTTAATDDNLTQIFRQIKASKSPTVFNYGASWCGVCCQILPVFRRLSSKFPKMWFVYADIDECPETTQHIRYTPTFHFYRDGERVDEMFGGGDERLHDRIWLHS